MPQKRQASPPKRSSPPPSSSSASEEEEEEKEGNDNGISVRISSQGSKIPSSKKPTFEPNQKQNPDSSSEDEEEEDDDDDDSKNEKAKFTTSQSKPPQPRKENEDDSDSESGSESDSPPAKSKPARPSRSADPSIKPISSKPMDASPKPKKPDAKPVVAAPSPAKPTAQKRRATAAESNDKESKKQKKPSAADAAVKDDKAGAKKQLFPRLWSPEDELSLLKGMNEFTKGGSDVYADMNVFLEFIKKFIQVDVSRSQLSDKIRRLKKKYMTNAAKAKKGKEPAFSKSHDKLAYDISNEIWGRKASTTEDHSTKVAENENGVDKLNADKKDASNAKSGRKTEEEIAVASPPPKSLENTENHTVISEGVGDREVLYPHLKDSLHLSGTVSISGLSGLGESEVKRAFELMSHSQAKKWDERLMRLQVLERDVYMERVTCVYELAKQCYDLIKSSMEL